jgi:hypothetical protein
MDIANQASEESFAFNSSVLDQGLPKGGHYSRSTTALVLCVDATSGYSQQGRVVWGVFVWFGKGVVVRGREGQEGGRPPGRGQAARSRRPPSPPPWPLWTLSLHRLLEILPP